jgi:dipeptidyl-peptidase-4
MAAGEADTMLTNVAALEQYIRTRRFGNGVPGSFQLAGDDSAALFLRSAGPRDPVQALWRIDLADGAETVVADARTIGTGDGTIPPEELARRERVRESGSGIVTYSATDDLRVVCFALDGQLYLVGGTGAGPEPCRVDVPGPVVDPRLAPDGERVAYVGPDGVTLARPDGSVTVVVGSADPAVTWGLAEHVAAEEMGRTRGHWWAPDSSRLLVARVDERDVPVLHIADPAAPFDPPTQLRYPAAGRPNADVSLALFALTGERVDVIWDSARFPYLAAVSYADARPLLTVQSRDQRITQVLEADPATGATTLLAELSDPQWTDLVDGVPARAPDGRLVTVRGDADTHRVFVDDVALTPASLQVRAVRGVGQAGVLLTASTDPVSIELWLFGWDGTSRRIAAPDAASAGVQDGRLGREAVLCLSADLERSAPRVQVHTSFRTIDVAVSAEEPIQPARPRLVRAGRRRLASALLLPTGHEPGEPLPVIVDSYGGPHAQRVLARQSAFTLSQWIADQGFAVLVTDGRGSPGRGLGWERAIHRDLATAPLQDQVDALEAVAAQHPDLDLTRVGIRGWSFGGYLALLGVLRRPDVFRAGVAGAPVTDWRLYDTHYTERYLGDPDADAAAYDASNVVGDAAGLRGRLLLIHGLNDDNVVAAHSLHMARALFLADRPHQLLALSGITHMAGDPTLYGHLLGAEIAFFRAALAD